MSQKMFFDLNVPIHQPLFGHVSKKGKCAQPVVYSDSEITSFEKKIDLLIHLGYTVFAFSQTVKTRIDVKSHVNTLNPFVARLRTRSGVVFLKRLNIILDQDSEKGFGLINANISLFNFYDLLCLIPTTHATLSLACLTHTLPSNLTAHVISLPLTLPRLPFHLKHTLLRTAIKNGAAFEINYVGAMGGENDPVIVDANAAESGPNAKRNWWSAARELVRVTKGKGLLISGGVFAAADYRAPRDVANLISMLGLTHDTAHEALVKSPKSLIARAQTRKTYRAVLSEPALIFSQVPKSSETRQPSNPEDDPSFTELKNDTLSKRPRENEDANIPLQSQPKRKRKRKPKLQDSADM